MPQKLQRRWDAIVPTGAFNRRISIQKPNDILTASGGRRRTWVTILQTWAHIEPFKGNEYWNAQQVESRFYTKVVIRYRQGMNISPDMQILYNNHIYNIRTVSVPVEAQTTIELLCQELQAKGSNPTQ